MEQRNKRIFTIIIAVISILLVTSTTLLFLEIEKASKLDKQIKEETNKIPDVTAFIDHEEEIKIYENIEESIKNKYEEYYTNINLLEQKIEKGESDKKIAYLTFDDGPYELTYQVLDLLKANNRRDHRAVYITLNISERSYCMT